METTIHFRLGVVDWSVVLVYLAAMTIVGLHARRRRKEQCFDEYYLASRRLGVPILVATFVSTFYGLGSILGTAEVGFSQGMSAFFALSLPYTLMYILMALMAPRFRELSPRTFSDIIDEAYGRFPRVITAICSFIYSTNTMELLGAGFVFSLVFSTPLWVGVLVATLVSVGYTYAGGLWADCATDLIQFCLMSVSLGLLLLISWNALGGFGNVYAGLRAYTGTDPWFYFHPLGGYLTPGLIVAYSLTSLAVLCEPGFFQRIFASRSPRQARTALLIATPIWASTDWACAIMGLLAASAVGLGLIPEPRGDQALLALILAYAPPGIMGVFLAGLLATAMSTADSYYLISAGNLAYDIYRPLFAPSATSRELLKLARSGVLISAALSFALAFVFEKIMGVWVFQASIMINTVLIPLYAAVLFRRSGEHFFSPLAGVLATSVGLFGTVLYYVLVTALGSPSEEWGTVIWNVNLGGKTYALWQEYGIFLIPPLVLTAYAAGVYLDKKRRGPSMRFRRHRK